MKKTAKKILSVILAITIALTTVLAAVAASNNECPLDIEIITKKEEYGALGKAKFIVEVTNTSNATVENVSAEAVFDELDPFGFGSEISAEDSALEPGETLRFEFKATLNAKKVGLNFVQRVILKVLRFFHGDIGKFPDEDFNDGRAMTSKTHKVTFGKYEVEQLVEVWYDGETGETYTVTFDLNYDGAPTPTTEKVSAGEYAPIDGIPERENYAFVGWYETDNLNEPFKFTTAVNNDLYLVARWVDIADETDTDNDGLTDPIEEYFGTDVTKADTDGDGLSDYIEVAKLNLNPLKKDSDNNFVDDGDEDSDSDGLSNIEEVNLGTDPALNDTDVDELDDKKELEIGTNPLNKDTDGDGVSDGKEIELGTDPLSAQDIFNIVMDGNDDNDTVKPSVQIELEGSQVETLHVEAFENDNFFPETMPGYMGKAYDFSVDGEFDKAIISFEFDSSSLSEGAQPTIYYFNEEIQELEELPTTVNGNVASAEVAHFSKYILVERTVYQESFRWTDLWIEDFNYTDVEIVFVIDDSGSMDWNDPSYERLNVARNLIDKLPANSKIGLIRFDGYYPESLTGALSSDREAVKKYLTNTYFISSGGTDMYNGIQKGFPLFESNEKTTLKMMIVLSDGETDDTYLHSSVISTANENNIRIYTVGLGSSTSYFNNYLKPLANNTGAEFYLASNATQLSDIYKDISEKIDLSADSDYDGIPDYYEDNMVLFNGVKVVLDKNNADTDGDGLKDGEEVEIKKTESADGSMVLVTGRIIKGNPIIKDTDGDGILDNKDSSPFVWDVSDRDLAMLSQLIYCDEFREESNLIFSSLSASEINSINEHFYGTASIEELKGWYLASRTELFYEDKTGGLCYGVFKKDNNVVVAVRGSYGEMSLTENMDWYNNFLTYPFKSDTDTDTLLYDIVDVVNKHKGKNDKLYITGHSRGGMLAQRAAAGLVQNNDGAKIERVVYFNGIGIIFAKGLWGKGKGWYDSLDSINYKVTRYRVNGDMVDGLGCHVIEPKSYTVVQSAIDNYDGEIQQKHALCNFTSNLMPERFSQLSNNTSGGNGAFGGGSGGGGIR